MWLELLSLLTRADGQRRSSRNEPLISVKLQCSLDPGDSGFLHREKNKLRHPLSSPCIHTRLFKTKLHADRNAEEPRIQTEPAAKTFATYPI